MGICWFIYWILERNNANDVCPGQWFACICLPLGIAGFIAGTWYYLRRVEP